MGGPAVTDEQKVTIAALDLFARILRGEIEEVERVLRRYYLESMPGEGAEWLRVDGFSPTSTLDRLRDRIAEPKSVLGLPSDGALGRFHPELHPAARLAWKEMDAIRGREDATAAKLDEKADAAWIAKYGEPWMGGRQ